MKHKLSSVWQRMFNDNWVYLCNGNGKQDPATANTGSSNASVLLGDGAGAFSSAAHFAVGANPNGVAVGDFNGDGKQDLATANAWARLLEQRNSLLQRI